MRKQISSIIDSKTKLWVKIMSLARKLWGCHQIPERSFFLHGYQFPLCARCTGVFVGYLFAILFLLLGCLIPILLSISFIFPLILDGGIQLLLNIISNNKRRFITVILFGFGIIQLIANVCFLIF